MAKRREGWDHWMQSVPAVEKLLILDMEGRGGGGEPEDKTNDPFVLDLVMQFFMFVKCVLLHGGSIHI